MCAPLPMGRRFFSPSGCGLYLSVVLPPEVCGEGGALLTTYAAVAVMETVEELTGVKPSVKWVNDVYLGGKKVCGILAEGKFHFETGKFDYAVLGIGINVRKMAFPAELAHLASDLETETGVQVDRDQLANALLLRLADLNTALKKRDFMKKYRENCFVLGKELEVHRGTEWFFAKALDVNDCGELLVEVDGEMRVLQSGEVSVRVT